MARTSSSSPPAPPAPPQPDSAPEPVMGHLREASMVRLDQLRPHPRNYRGHPQDQVDHLARSLEEFGQYRNVVATVDGTILAGHGVVQAARHLGWSTLRVVVLPIDPEDPRALKLVVADNEIGHLAERDDRLLSELLKEIQATDPTAGLLGTGYDQAMLATLVMVTRPASEVANLDAARHWAGMPGYENGSTTLRVVVNFRNEQDRLAFLELVGAASNVNRPAGEAWSIWWPHKEREDLASLRFE